MTKRHKLLERQIRKHLQQTLVKASAEIQHELDQFFNAIDLAYHDFDSDRALVERAQDLSSKELGEEKLRAENKARELEIASAALVEAQQKLLASAKMTALGEMAGGIAHEINTPLAIIALKSECLEDILSENVINKQELLEGLNDIKLTVSRIAKIVSGLRFFAREGQKEGSSIASVAHIIEETLTFCQERFLAQGVKLETVKDASYPVLNIDCRMVAISQVLLNLLNNAFDAVQSYEEKWIRIEVKDLSNTIEISVTDSGSGIPAAIADKIMQPFFTTKSIGKGTGLGLSTSKGIVEEHRGQFWLDMTSPNTKFVIHLPKAQNKKSA